MKPRITTSCAHGAAQTRPKPSERAPQRQSKAIAAALPLGLLLAGCGAVSLPDLGTGNILSTASDAPAAVVVADEPRAAEIGRDVLARGGSVVDAATATYFALTVTMPAAAGLGGGGLCVVHDADARRTVSVDFLPRAAAGGGPFAVPAAVRGFAAMHAEGGRMRWAELIAPAERLAATGVPMSRAQAQRLQAAAGRVRSDARLASRYVREDGALRGEGERIVQPDVALALAAIRTQGPGALHGGALGARVAAEAASRGGAIQLYELSGLRIGRGETVAAQIGSGLVHGPARRTGAGALAEAALQRLAAEGRADAGAARIALGAAAAGFGAATPPADLGSTGFVAADDAGNAVACGLTMNGPFGTGQSAGDTGIVFAAAPNAAEGLAGAFLIPAIVTDLGGAELRFAGAGVGGLDGAGAVLAGALNAAQGGTEMIVAASTLETANAVLCPGGLPGDARTCRAMADPTGAGLAAVTGSGF